MCRSKLCRILLVIVTGIALSLFCASIVGRISVLRPFGKRWFSPAVIIDVPSRLCSRLYKSHLYPMLITSRESPVDIIIRAVYFDNRPRDGHNNVTVFLLEVQTDILKNNLIRGCGVDNFAAVSYKVRDCLLNVWLRKSGVFEKEGMTHWCTLLDCYDLPVTNSSKAYVLYNHYTVQHLQRGQWVGSKNLIHRTVMVDSPQPVFFPSHAKAVKKNTEYKFSITVCRGPVFGTPPYLSEWLRYQRTIGVDHIYFIVEESFLYDNGLNIPEVAKALQEGYLSYSVWKTPIDDAIGFYRSQLLANEDCLYRLQGQSDYVLVADTDDFFNPVTPHTSLHYYVDKYCHQNKTCGALNMKWIHRHTECGLKGKIPADGNVTSVLASEVKHDLDVHGKVNYKTVHRAQTEVDIQVHKHGFFLPGFDHVLLPVNQAYVAHIREHKVHEGTRCAPNFSSLNYSVRCVC